MFDWLRHYPTIPLFLMVIVPWFTRWPRVRERMLLYLWWLLPFAALANARENSLSAVYSFYDDAAIIAAYATVYMGAHSAAVSSSGICCGSVCSQHIYHELYRVGSKDAPIPLADRGQFIEDCLPEAGQEVVTYLTAEAAHQKVNVYTEGTFGLMPYAIELYLVDNPNVKITGIWPLPDDMPQEISRRIGKCYLFCVKRKPDASFEMVAHAYREYEKANREDHKKLRFLPRWCASRSVTMRKNNSLILPGTYYHGDCSCLYLMAACSPRILRI